MKIVDLHVDTLMQILDRRTKGEEIGLYKNDLNVDLERMQKSDYKAQIFACYVDLGNEPFTDSHYGDALEMIKIFKDELACHKGIIREATDSQSYYKNAEEGLISGFISVEEGGIIGKDIKRLEELHNLGIRIITLTWNYENEIGFPNFNWEYQNNGLKPFGREVLERMDELGIIVDVSHLSDGGFNDIVKYGKRPFLATHSNSRALQNHPRNLTDEMIKSLGNKGGLAGLNFSPTFLDGKRSSVELMVKHAKYMLNIGGDEVLALGTDYDGIAQDALELKGVQDVQKLIDALIKEGLTERQVEGIAYKNFERFLDRYERG